MNQLIFTLFIGLSSVPKVLEKIDGKSRFWACRPRVLQYYSFYNSNGLVILLVVADLCIANKGR